MRRWLVGLVAAVVMAGVAWAAGGFTKPIPG